MTTSYDMYRDVSIIADRMKSIDESLESIASSLNHLCSVIDDGHIPVYAGPKQDAAVSALERIDDHLETVAAACVGGNFQVRALLLADEEPIKVDVRPPLYDKPGWHQIPGEDGPVWVRD